MFLVFGEAILPHFELKANTFHDCIPIGLVDVIIDSRTRCHRTNFTL
jgi:hypothetical protein